MAMPKGTAGITAGTGWLLICSQIGWVNLGTFDFVTSAGWWGGSLILVGIFVGIDEFGSTKDVDRPLTPSEDGS